MMKNLKRLLSMMLALSMVFSLVVPAAATETHEHDHAEEAKQEESINMEAVLENITVNAEDVDFELDLTNKIVLADPDTEVDMEDPAIIEFESELKAIKVWDEAAQQPVPLTEEQIMQVLGLYQQYLDHWTENADTLGLQVPFFLDYNDKGEDGLGVLGEMLALAGVSVDAVRAGYMTMDDLTGMILNFYYGDQLGVAYYGAAIEAARDEVMQLIEESGAQTEAQKLLIINDWLAHNNTFDMPYIMNADKDTNGDGVIDENDDNKDAMVAPDPVKHEHYDDVLAVMTDVYEGILTDTFETQIRDGLEAEFKKQYYEGAIKNIIYEGALAEMRQNEEIVGAAKNAYWQAAYDKAYEEYVSHEHSATVVYEWTEETDENGVVTGYSAVAATATCTCEKEMTAFAEITSSTTTKEPNCVETGIVTYTATATVKDAEGNEVAVKNATDTKEVTVATNDAHAYGEGEVSQPAGCTSEGVMTYTCTNCGVTKNEAIAKTGHTLGETGRTEATCGADGQISYECTVCGATLSEVLPATGNHTWDEGVVTTAATCSEVGIMTFTCEVCGQTKPEDIEKIAHVDEDADENCDVCQAPIHNYDAGEVITAATCCAEGLIRYTCEDEGCGYTKDVVTPATNEHVYNEGTVTLEATCVSEGTMTYDCTTDGCDNTKTEVIEKNEDNHDYDDGVITQEATCKAEGVKTYTCKLCSVSKIEAVARIGHADSDEDGKCDGCGKELTVQATADEQSIVVNADETEGTEGTETPEEGEEEPVNPEAEAYAKAKADEALANMTDEELNAIVEQIVTGTEEETTQCEQQAEAAVEQFMTENGEAIAADPAGFVDSQEMFQALTEYQKVDEQGNPVTDADGNPVYMTVAEYLHAGWAQFWAGVENGDKVDVPVTDDAGNVVGSVQMTMEEIIAAQMDTPMDDLPQKEDGTHMTPNEAVPVFAAQAAAGLTDGIINYWEGSHFGALGFGTSVCLGYTKAFTYLVQCLHPEIYLKDGKTDTSNAANWKTRDEVYVYGEDGKIDINQNYVVDAVRVTFDASVTMYGETEDNFNSDHFWNAVKIDGQWYYADPCYTDVFTEVMMRDRVETDGQMNHLYFIFSHTAAVNMYDGNYKEIKSMYDAVATSTDYEDSWISRIKSNTYFADGYAYYMYDSTDMLTLMEEYENQNQNSEADFEDPTYKIVRHKLTGNDAGNNGDEDYETLIVFNEEVSEDEFVAKVLDPSTGSLVENELLNELYAKQAAYAEIYPSIAINAAFYNGKVYFNIANCILSYDVASGALAMVKEYNTVQGLRDTTNPFGGMAFSVVESGGDFTVENPPIAGMTIKDDGNMYVSVATNFSFISGKADRCDPASEGYGYEYEESNYNADYNSYMDYGDYDDAQLESYGYTKEINDNDEFMWTANFVEKLSMSHLGGGSHSYEAVSVAAACGVDAYTENRCTTCGAIEADSRVYEEGTAIEHHFVEWNETYYTKDDAGSWNTGVCYVCTECGYSVTEPKEPTGQMAEQEGAMEEYEEAKAIFDAAKASAGHDYEPTDAEWAEDNSSVTFSILECSAVCPERKPYLDCLLNDDTITITLENAVTFDVTEIETIGTCPEGVTKIYKVIGEVEVDGEMIPFTATKTVELEPTDCTYVDGICSVCGDCSVKRISGSSRVKTALSVAAALKDTLGVEKFDAVVIAAGDNEKFADALAGSYLANVKGAPILLYTASGMSDLNVQFIQENLSEDGTIYLLGGANSIPDAATEKLADYKVERIAGSSRYTTNLAILEMAGVGNKEILVATGKSFADSLSISAAGLPILLIDGNASALRAEQIEFLEGLKGNKVTIIGGNNSVSVEMEDAIEKVISAEVDRVSGNSRQMTSVEFAERYFEAPELALITYSDNFPDGLAGGPLAYAMGAPLLLTKEGKEAIANEYITEQEIEAGYILGGTASVSDETAAKAFGIVLPEDGEYEIPYAYLTE